MSLYKNLFNNNKDCVLPKSKTKKWSTSVFLDDNTFNTNSHEKGMNPPPLS